LARPVILTEYETPAINPAASVVSANMPTTEVEPAFKQPTTSAKPAVTETITVTKIFSSSRQSRTPAMQRLGPKIRTSSEPAVRSRSSPRTSRDRSRTTEEEKKEEEKGEPTKPTRKRAALVEDLSADKSSDDCEMETADKSSEPDPADAAANKSLEDLDQDEDTEADAKTDESEFGLTDEEEASNFRQLLADLKYRFEEQQAARRQKRKLKTRAKKRDRK